MKRILLALALLALAVPAALQLTATPPAAPETDELRIDRTEIVEVEAFTRTLDDGTVLTYDRQLVVEGEGFTATGLWPQVELDGETAWGMENPNSKTITIYLPRTAVGGQELVVSMPNANASTSVTL